MECHLIPCESAAEAALPHLMAE